MRARVPSCLACLLVQVLAVITLLAIKKRLCMNKCMLTHVSLKVEIVKNNKEFLEFNFSNGNLIGQMMTPSA